MKEFFADIEAENAVLYEVCLEFLSRLPDADDSIPVIQ